MPRRKSVEKKIAGGEKDSVEDLGTTDPVDIPDAVKNLRETFLRGDTKALEWRRAQLKRFLRLINEGTEELQDALWKDLHKDASSAFLTEIVQVRNETQGHMDHLEEYVKPKTVSTNLLNVPGWSQVNSDPLGVVLIIGCWNYPVNLTLLPVAGALAAGNTVAIRLPSDNYAPYTAAAIQRLVARYFDKDVVYTFRGVRNVTAAVLEERFDKIMFTGGCFVGKKVAEAAAKHLTPTVLELGGKSPCVVDETADIALSARRIVWATYLNAGQTCIRPDFLIVHSSIRERLKMAMEKEVRKQFGFTPKMSREFGRIVNARAHARLTKLLKETNAEAVVFGGETDADELYVAPTLLDYGKDAKAFWSSPSMAAEIFGPILPMLSTNDIQSTLEEKVIRGEKPLAFYCFTENRGMRRFIQDKTTSGSLVFNDAVIHLSNEALPFGGVGKSGMGSYHGRSSFDTFSHQRSVLFKTGWLDLAARYPPYNSKKTQLLSVMLVARPYFLSSTPQRTLAWLATFAALFYFRNNWIDVVIAVLKALKK